MREREEDKEKQNVRVEGKPLSGGIMGNTYSSQFSFRSLRGNNTGELSIVKALKTDGSISGKKKQERWGKCNYPARAVWEFYCLIIIP